VGVVDGFDGQDIGERLEELFEPRHAVLGVLGRVIEYGDGAVGISGVEEDAVAWVAEGFPGDDHGQPLAPFAALWAEEFAFVLEDHAHAGVLGAVGAFVAHVAQSGVDGSALEVFDAAEFEIDFAGWDLIEPDAKLRVGDARAEHDVGVEQGVGPEDEQVG
jgi:hypothetical protein